MVRREGPAELVGEQAAVDEFAHQVAQPALFAEVEHLEDVRMAEPRGGRGLGPEALAEPGVLGERAV